ncbi:MAG TPA: LysR substrate-binding domain-containing protein [Kofleriaceae bacterium]|nr:LysR substrate-binding domain-containing protein [Kofleriaceae bacterium]
MDSLASSINLHHLRYFWAVANDGNLTRTARRLRVAQSALSAQIRQLEGELGEPLFTRAGRRLILTEAGKIALAYADDIFTAGRELVATLKQGRARDHLIRIGAVATLSRNFQRSFLKPLLAVPGAQLRLETGSLEELLARLESHTLDLVLSNRTPAHPAERHLRCRRLARQPVSIIGARAFRFRFPRDLAAHALILPSRVSELRLEFDALCERVGVRVRVLAEVDDMATIRLLAADSDALALVPSVVVRDELRQGVVHELCVVPEIAENFYAITRQRRFSHPLVRLVLERDEAELLAMQPPSDDATSL